jgi:RNA polymerase sigma-70 factor (sigma-E family)
MGLYRDWTATGDHDSRPVPCQNRYRLLATIVAAWRLSYMGAELTALRHGSSSGRGRTAEVDPDQAVTALYQAHASGLIRIAVVMLGDRAAAEDVVQDAFCGLYRRWSHLADPDKSLPYVRSAVLNGCRSVLRREARHRGIPADPPAASAEAGALIGEEHREVAAALRRLPARQREALVLRFFLDLDGPQIAQSMGISEGTVKSTVSRGLAALAKLLGDDR